MLHSFGGDTLFGFFVTSEELLHIWAALNRQTSDVYFLLILVRAKCCNFFYLPQKGNINWTSSGRNLAGWETSPSNMFTCVCSICHDVSTLKFFTWIKLFWSDQTQTLHAFSQCFIFLLWISGLLCAPANIILITAYKTPWTSWLLHND